MKQLELFRNSTGLREDHIERIERDTEQLFRNLIAHGDLKFALTCVRSMRKTMYHNPSQATRVMRKTMTEILKRHKGAR